MSETIILVENDTLHWSKETMNFNDMCIRALDRLYTPELPLENQSRGYIVLRTLVVERRPVEYLEGYRSVFHPLLFNLLVNPIAWSIIRYSHVQESL